MEIALQEESQGILYEGPKKLAPFIQCIFEESNVEGRNERYEFRCASDLQCCGRTCCIPEEKVVPLWLILLLVFLTLAILAAAAALWAYMCAKKRKPKPKKEYGDIDASATKGGYSALASDRDAHALNGNGFGRNGAARASDRAILVREHDAYSTPENLYGTGRGGGAYGNESYSHSDSRYGPVARGPYDYRSGYGRDYGRYGPGVHADSDGESHRVHETVEESFKQEITYERPASTDSREML